MSDVKRISPQEAAALCQSEGYTYLDVRTEAEWAAGHPAGAHNLPLLLSGPGGLVPNPRFLALALALYPKDTKLVVGCKSGGRSLKAATALIGAGFTAIVEQRAGWDGARNSFGKVTEPGWTQAGLPSEQETEGGSYAELTRKAEPGG